MFQDSTLLSSSCLPTSDTFVLPILNVFRATFLRPVNMKFPSLTKAWHNASYPAISPSNTALSVAGKTIFITGGGAGIGLATARAFAAAGASTRPSLAERKRHSYPQRRISSPRMKELQSFPTLLTSLIRKLWTLPSLPLEKSISWFTMQHTCLAWYQSANRTSKIGGPALKSMSKVPSL